MMWLFKSGSVSPSVNRGSQKPEIARISLGVNCRLNLSASRMSSSLNFGFGSIGDIITVVQLAASIANVLRDSTGASHEYQELVIELDSLSLTLDFAYNTVSPLSSISICASVVRALLRDVSECSKLLKRFQGKIEGYQRSLGKGGSGNKWRDSWVKIGWGLFQKESLIELRTELSRRGAAIQLSISSLNM